MTLLGKFVGMKVDAELKKMKEIMWCKEHRGRTVIARGC